MKQLMTEEEKNESHKRAVEKYMKNNDRINIVLPKGTKQRIADLGYSVNDFSKSAILAELERAERYLKK